MHAVSAPCPRCLTMRRAGCFYVPVAQQGEQQPIEAASRWFKSIPEHQFAADPVGGASLTHGLITTFGWRVREKGSFLPFLVEPPHAVGGHRIHKPVQAFPAGCASVPSQHGNVLAFICRSDPGVGRDSRAETGAEGSRPRSGFYAVVAQAERRQFKAEQRW